MWKVATEEVAEKGKKGRKDYEEWKEEWWRKDISVVVSSEVVAPATETAKMKKEDKPAAVK